MMGSELSRGMVAATLAYVIWGMLPIYWKSLGGLPAYEILGHRMAWSLPFVILILLFSRRRVSLRQFEDRRAIRFSAISSTLLAVNWLIYIWAVNAGFIVETSLGYYINPLVSVAFGGFFLKERLRTGQIGAILLALAGVVYLTFVYGRFPWITLAMAMTFAVYGLLHKKISIAPLKSLYLETLIFFLPALLLIIYLGKDGNSGFVHGNTATMVMLAGTGLVTTVPLLLFGYAAQIIPLSLLGILQYTAPTLNLLIGVFVYGEEFPVSRMIGFVLVWSALLVFICEGLMQKARQRQIMLSKQ
jgi:chloramphenicol-sensitive protein RarD